MIDGEIVIATDHGLNFEALQQRIHPAESRVRVLAEQTPASFIAFDLLALGGDDVGRRRDFLAYHVLLAASTTTSTRWRPTMTAAPCTAAVATPAITVPPEPGWCSYLIQQPTEGRHVLKESTMQRIHPESSTTGRSAVSDTRIDATTASDTSAPAMTSLEARTTTAARWRQILPAALCAAALSATLTISAIASAAPREWDIEAYDKCTATLDSKVDEKNDPDTYANGLVACCVESGGVWSGEQNCVAPPAEVRPGQVRPGLTPLPGVTLQPATPTSAPPTGARNLPTFTPSTG